MLLSSFLVACNGHPLRPSRSNGDGRVKSLPEDRKEASVISLVVNGKEHKVDISPDTRLLYVLRNDLGLNGPRFGCGLGQCGACTVIMDGEAVLSCVMPVKQAIGHKILTLEGLGTAKKPHPLQKAFIEEQAAQCGYCIDGMIMRSKVLLDHTPNPTEQQIRDALAHNLCRCGTHLNIIRAVQRAAREMSPRRNNNDRTFFDASSIQ